MIYKNSSAGNKTNLTNRNISQSRQYKEDKLNKIGSALGVQVIWETHFEEKTLNYQSIKANGWLAGSGGENCSWQLPFEGQ